MRDEEKKFLTIGTLLAGAAKHLNELVIRLVL
jgi:hypothetical protein